MRVIVALGGNALLRRGEPLDAAVQRRNVERAAAAIATIARDHRVIVTHGNGPQIGLLALQAEAYAGARSYPLDILGAESEGMIGYLIEQELINALPGQPVATLLTQIEVDPRDPAFKAPTKPIGPVYAAHEAERLAAERGWTVASDGAHFRRVVPSPQPQRILELSTVRLLVEAGVLVVCAGGGGIPVVVQDGAVCGVEGVIDKDAAAALLAESIAADALLLLTDVDAVYMNWGQPEARPIGRTTPIALRAMTFESGSMAPKVDAACRFVERTDKCAAIGAIEHAGQLLYGKAGTVIKQNRTHF